MHEMPQSDCFPRFLRATRWNVADCIKKLETTLKWRREYGIYDTLTAESIKEHVRALRILMSQPLPHWTLNDVFFRYAVSERENPCFRLRC